MKVKCSFAIGMAALSALVASCMKDPDNHMLDVIYPKPYSVLFADQTRDSIIFSTFDGYTLHSYADWIDIVGEKSENINHDDYSLYTFTRWLEATPNTTGGTRSAVVGVNSYEYSSGARYYQLGYVNIYHPSPRCKDFVFSNIPDTVTFSMADSANVTLDSVCFVVEDDWVLSVSAEEGSVPSWIRLDNEAGAEGENKVYVSMEPNKDMENDRKATLLMQTSGISHSIGVTQYKATKKQLEEMEKGAE